MNKGLKLGILALLSLSLLTGCGDKKEPTDKVNEEEQIKTNTNENVIKDQELEVFKFTNTSLVYENGNSVLEIAVTNTSAETQYLEEFKIHVRDKDGNEIVTMTGFIGDQIGAGETKIITSTYGEDLTTAASIDYEIVR